MMEMGWPTLFELLWSASLETFYMVGVSMFLTVLLGLPLGILLVVTERGGILELPAVSGVLGAVVNIGRSPPFIILLIALIPFTRLVVGKTIGSTAAIVPLTIAAIPFFARVVETSLREVDQGLVEAAEAMGCSHWQIISKVLVPEALPSLVLGMTITLISLISYSAMAGVVGGGGLGDVAIRYGYHRFNTPVMLTTLVLLILMVQALQLLGNWIARRLDRR